VPSRRERIWTPVSAAILIAILLCLTPGETLAQQSQRPDDAEIARALENVSKDPNLGGERSMKMLHWRESDSSKKRPAWWLWIVDLFRWLDQSARYLIWVAAAALAAYLLFYLVRLTSERREATVGDVSFVAPSHVRDLDIRPESLPADIGAAARALWDRGERRAALALLYRGMLSRFAHVHQIPVRDSSTEGDCLALAVVHLPEPTTHYVARLVHEWQRVGYGRESSGSATIHGLCDGFSPALDRRTRSLEPGTAA
jgi:hypothetical protein